MSVAAAKPARALRAPQRAQSGSNSRGPAPSGAFLSPRFANLFQLVARGFGFSNLGGISSETIPLTPAVTAAPPPESWERRQRRARTLAVAGSGWHVAEFAVAIGAGIAAGSIALVGFGADSLIEAASGLVILWLFTGKRRGSPSAERRAQRLIAVSYIVLGAYVAVESVRDLAGGYHPGVSWVGVGLAALTAPTMPLLARAKRKVGRQLGSDATVSEAGQNLICAYLSIALLIGLLANALAGWWWADPASALVIAAIALNEGRETWSADAPCECC